MKSIRRSLKDRQSPPGSAGSNHSGNYSSAHHVLSGGGAGSVSAAPGTTLPPSRSGAHGKTPPKKVIRAVTSVKSRSPQELSFEAGDFFHVVGERIDNVTGEVEWFDAANPLTGARGLVPANCFQVLGRNEKENGTRAGSVMSHRSGHTLSPPIQQGNQFSSSNGASSSGARTSGGTTGNGISPTPSPSSSTFPHRSLPNQAKPARPRTQPLYGIVQYDFRAERADELDAKRGENLIVIAQSNHEWFVAKPIGRLGGPGLIPVSFVAISDTTTGLSRSAIAGGLRLIRRNRRRAITCREGKGHDRIRYGTACRGVEEADCGIQASLDTIRTVRLFKSIDTHTRLDSEHAIWFSRRTRQFVSYKLREWKRATDIWSRPDFLASKLDK